MEFDKKDILQLYGKHLFIIPDDKVAPQPETKPVAEPVAVSPPVETPIAEPQPVAESGPVHFQAGKPVTWKLKPDTRLALVLRSEEFANKQLTSALKGYIVGAAIDTKLIGFGILEGEGDEWDLRDMPCPVGVVFGGGATAAGPIMLGTNQVFAVNSLAAISTDRGSQNQLKELLAALTL